MQLALPCVVDIVEVGGSVVVTVVVDVVVLVVVATAMVVDELTVLQPQPTASEPHQIESALQWSAVVPQWPHLDRQ